MERVRERVAASVTSGGPDASPSEAAEPSFADLVDLRRYPLHAPGSETYRSVLEIGRQGLATTGACVFEGFLQPSAVARTLSEVDPLRAGAFVCGQPHNVYLVDADPVLVPAHPRNRLVRSAK